MGDEQPEDKKCDFGICTNCFYNYFLELNLQKIDAELNLFVEGERWWGEKTGDLIFKVTQNPLVATISRKYLESNKFGSPPLPEPWDNYADVKEEIEQEPLKEAEEDFLQLKSPDDVLAAAFTLPVLEPAFEQVDPPPEETTQMDEDPREETPLVQVGQPGEGEYVLLDEH